MGRSSSLMVVVAAVVMAVSVLTAEAQTQSCASNLISCADYLNATTRPPNSCCDPMKKAVADDLQCLCNLFNNPSFLAGLGINVTQALNLPRLCGISSDATACNKAQAPIGSNNKPPPGSTPGNAVAKIASSGIVGLFLISTCMMLF